MCRTTPHAVNVPPIINVILTAFVGEFGKGLANHIAIEPKAPMLKQNQRFTGRVRQTPLFPIRRFY